MKRFSLLLLVSLLSVGSFLIPSHVYACSCAPTRSPVDNAKDYEHVFSGRVTRVVKRGIEHEAAFTLTKSYKGYQNKEFVVYTPEPEGSDACGFSFERDREYFVYAYVDKQGRIATTTCSQIKRIEDATEDIAQLGARKAADTAKQGASKKVQDTFGTNQPVVFTLLFMMVILILGLTAGSKKN